jgi:hypothetical protein
MIGTTIRALEKAAEAEHRRFHGQFQELYRNLARLGGRVRTATRGLDARAAGKFAAGTGDAPASLASGVAQLRQEELWKTAGGAGLGAVVGTLMLPGVGTILGGAVGGLLSRLFGGPSHAEVQQRCWAQLEPAVVRGFEAFAAQAGDHLDHAVREIEAGLAAAVGRYAGQYRRLVDEMIARDEQAAAELANLSRAVRQELTDVRGRQEQLARARADLRAL